MSAAKSRSVPAPDPMSTTVAPAGFGAIACGLPTPANDSDTGRGIFDSSAAS